MNDFNGFGFLAARTPPVAPLQGRLFVLFHGLGRKGYSRLDQVEQALHEDFPDADIYRPELFAGWPYSSRPAARTAAIVLQALDRICAARQREGAAYKDIVFIGYSAGAAIARKVLIGAWGRAGTSPLESEHGLPNAPDPRRHWHRSVSRFVLIAGITRGWAVSGRNRWQEWLLLNFWGFFGHMLPFQKPALFDLRRGAPFIVNTRLQWLERMRQTGVWKPDLKIVQMLGANDEMVSPVEGLNLALEGTGTAILEVPFSNHRSIVEVFARETWDLLPGAAARRAARNAAAAERRRLLGDAIAGRADATQAAPGGPLIPAEGTLTRQELDDYLPPEPNPLIENVAFVIHGIRDDGFWTKKVGARIKRAAGAGAQEKWATVTPSYGYFAMLPFALPWIRRNKVEWLMDSYVQARIQYSNPLVKFHFVGHSNGTYLCAAALRDYSSARFERICFAGSVVRADYPWATVIGQGRAGQVFNYVATRDAVVGMFPNGLRHWRGMDLGGAGHLGFDAESAEVRNLKYIAGGHGAGVQENRWDEIARYVVHGTEPAQLPAPGMPVENRRAQSWPMSAAGRLSPIFLLAFVLILAGVFEAFGAAVLNLDAPIVASRLYCALEQAPLIGGAASVVHGWLSPIWNWWTQDVWPLGRLAGLAAYVFLLRFITLRF